MSAATAGSNMARLTLQAGHCWGLGGLVLKEDLPPRRPPLKLGVYGIFGL